jgi:hypothetical protein
MFVGIIIDMDLLGLDVFVPSRPPDRTKSNATPSFVFGLLLGCWIHFAGLLSWFAERCRAKTRLWQWSWLALVPEHNPSAQPPDKKQSCLPPHWAVSARVPGRKIGVGFCCYIEGMVILPFCIYQHPAVQSSNVGSPIILLSTKS